MQNVNICLIILGKWNGTVGKCDPNNCTLPAIDNSVITPNKTIYTNGTIVNITCKHNYVLKGLQFTVSFFYSVKNR